MQPGQARNTTTVEEQAVEGFFIPDLCAPRSVFVMVLLAELMVLVYALAASELPIFNWDLLATCSLFVQWVVLLSAALLCRLRQPFSRLSLPVVSAVSLGLVLLVTAISSFLALQFYPQLSLRADANWWLLRNLLLAAVIAGIVLRYFYLQQQLRVQEKLELEARLDSLRVRIRPHFLFNTLNSIASLIGSRPEVAEQAVEDLAELFRASLQENRRPTTVADELRLCETYLGIEQLRLGDRLQVHWDVAAQVREEPMPCLVLQPLVENAVYHGVSQLAGGGAITIVAGYAGGAIRVTVDNPVPEQALRSGGHQMAMANVEERLRALYGSAGHLRAERKNGRFHVELSYPRGEAI